MLPIDTSDISGNPVESWSSFLNDQPFLLASSVREARLLVAQGLDLDSRSVIEVSPVMTRDLAHTLDRTGAGQVFEHMQGVDFVWRESVGGFELPAEMTSVPTILDFADTLPSPAFRWSNDDPAVVALFGLHLSGAPEHSGALLVFNATSEQSLTLYHRLRLLMAAAEPPTGAMAQLTRLERGGGLASRQEHAVHEVQRGIVEAAGLPVIGHHQLALPLGVAVEIPEGVDAAVFSAYVQGEQTPFMLMSQQRPPIYRYFRSRLLSDPADRRMAAYGHIGFIPVGPDFTDEEIGHAVLGVVKAAEYVGVRWWTDPARAASYAHRMIEMYGPDHDAYRPVFPVPDRRETPLSGSRPADPTPVTDDSGAVTIARD